MIAILKIKEIDGKIWEVKLFPNSIYTIGRGKENDIVLKDRRVSRKHAQISVVGMQPKIIDGYIEDGEIKRSINRVLVNGQPRYEKNLELGDIITIGETTLEVGKNFVEKPFLISSDEQEIAQSPAKAENVEQPKDGQPENDSTAVNYDDKPLGHTQLLISASEIIGKHSNISFEAEIAAPKELKDLRRKAKVLELLYEMSKTLGTVFDLKEIFERATDLIFRGTPADRVIALLSDDSPGGEVSGYDLSPIAVRTRDENLKSLTGRMTVSRTITHKVMREKVALLSQDAITDAQFSGAASIVSQGIRSTICAPLITESNVHGVVYADRLDPFSTFSSDDLELISAVAAQTAVTVETVKAHRRLAREEVARANYSRFMPEYVVRQLLENPNSFRLGGVNQTITVLFADIRGFTAISENANPEKIVGLLNRFFSAMTEIIFAGGGTLNKYTGDGLMAIFGAPTATSKDAENALKTAVAMQQRIVTLNSELESKGFVQIAVGIGLHTGEATVGYIGSEQRSEYTAIGDTVNLASRLESNAKGGQILISEATAEGGGNLFSLVSQKPLTVKNRLQPISLFEVKWN
ncbi:MAG: FHA domain-containing protein [Acidobacteriota bacterium]|nr:FHA domain-containing protein [Acidobacteriota bacterium]